MQFVAGIDGGGTKTTVECRSLSGAVLGRKVFGAFNLNSIGPRRFAELLKEITDFLAETGDCVSLCAGAAGVSNPQVRDLVRQAMEQAGIARWQLVGDHEIALYGALEGQPGCALISGTGSICFGRNSRGETARAGGWGHLIDDGGSGYALGRDALSALVRSWDGRRKESRLTELLQAHLGCETRQEVIAYVYGGEKSRIAALAPLVEQAAGSGDPAAISIIRANARALAELVCAVSGTLGLEAGEAALLGGLLTHDTHLRQETVAQLAECLPDLRPAAPRQDAAAGAAMMALALR